MRIKRMNCFVKIITFGWPFAITLAPFGIYIDAEDPQNFPITINEEKIHWKQQMEMLMIFFYIWYALEWIIKALTPPMGAYIALGFEREAKANRYDYNYYITRKHYAWIKYIRK